MCVGEEEVRLEPPYLKMGIRGVIFYASETELMFTKS